MANPLIKSLTLDDFTAIIEQTAKQTTHNKKKRTRKTANHTAQAVDATNAASQKPQEQTPAIKTPAAVPIEQRGDPYLDIVITNNNTRAHMVITAYNVKQTTLSKSRRNKLNQDELHQLNGEPFIIFELDMDSAHVLDMPSPEPTERYLYSPLHEMLWLASNDWPVLVHGDMNHMLDPWLKRFCDIPKTANNDSTMDNVGMLRMQLLSFMCNAAYDESWHNEWMSVLDATPQTYAAIIKHLMLRIPIDLTLLNKDYADARDIVLELLGNHIIDAKNLPNNLIRDDDPMHVTDQLLAYALDHIPHEFSSCFMYKLGSYAWLYAILMHHPDFSEHWINRIDINTGSTNSNTYVLGSLIPLVNTVVQATSNTTDTDNRELALWMERQTRKLDDSYNHMFITWFEYIETALGFAIHQALLDNLDTVLDAIEPASVRDSHVIHVPDVQANRAIKQSIKNHLNGIDWYPAHIADLTKRYQMGTSGQTLPYSVTAGVTAQFNIGSTDNLYTMWIDDELFIAINQHCKQIEPNSGIKICITIDNLMSLTK